LPANLPPEAKGKWIAAQNARNPKEKIQLFQEFLSAVPKHKGNERLRAQVKSKIAELKREIAAQRSRRSGSRSPWVIEREGAAQVVLFGLTNAGRSSLLKALTNARPEIGSYAYTTRIPVPGMLTFEDIQIQLIEIPAPLGSKSGEMTTSQEGLELIRNANGLALVVDLSEDPIQQFRSLRLVLDDIRVSVEKPDSRVEILREKGTGEIRIAAYGAKLSCPPERIRELLQSYGLRNALVRVYGEADIEDVEDAILENVTVYKPTVLIANKVDSPGAREKLTTLKEEIQPAMPLIITSCLTGEGLQEIGSQLFSALGLIRVYTKDPNEAKPSNHPFVVPAGTTVRDLARNIHTDLANRYRYSRIWGPTSKFAGERVGPDHVLADHDIVEIHAE